MLNDKGQPYHEEHGLPVLRILTYRGTEYCGRADQHDNQLFLAVNMIGHTRTKVKSSQTNGLYERVHKTILQKVYQVTCRKKIYESVKALQADLGLDPLVQYRPHPSRKNMLGKPSARDYDGRQRHLEGKFIY